MIIIIIYTIISFLLDALISNFVGTNLANPSYFITIYSVIALVVSYHFFDNDNKYLKILIILGILFDVVYTNTFLLNIVLLLIIYFVIKWLNMYIPNNLFTINIKTLLAIGIYHSLSFLILSFAKYDHYTFKLLLTVLSSNIIMTIIYTTISYLLIKKLYYKKYYKKIK